MNPFEQQEVLSQRYPAATIYMENSNLTPARNHMFQEKTMEFSQDESYSSGKSYPLCDIITLPASPILKGPVERIIGNRRTRRNFSRKGVQIAKLARILKSAYGVTSKGSEKAGDVMLRACPSAGALYPLELYPVVLRSKDLALGVYHYNVKNHSLEIVKKGDFLEELDNNLLGAELIPGADVALIITSVIDRSLAKYGERGYRFILIEVGHLAQNISLVCESLGFNSVCMGGFYEKDLADLLSTDIRSEPVQYVILLGAH